MSSVAKLNPSDFRAKCNELRNQFPHLFWTHRPWAIGSGKSIRQFAKDIPEHIINVCIGMHTASREYLEASARGDHRITPDGRDAGPLTEMEKSSALDRLTTLEAKGALKKALNRPHGFVMPKEGFRSLALQRRQLAENAKANKLIAPKPSDSEYQRQVCESHARLPSYEMALKKSKRIQFRTGNGDSSFSIWKCHVCGGYHFGNRNTKSHPKSSSAKRHKVEKNRLADMDDYVDSVD